MLNIVEAIICETFEKNVGRWQVKHEKPKAFEIRFRTKIDYDKEEGYRWLTMRIYGPMNYIAVFTREEWNVIPQDELEYDEETTDSNIKEDSIGYREGKSEWKKEVYHDSCWRTDGVHRVLWENRDKIQGVDGPEWYRIVELSKEELEEIEQII